MSDTVDLGASNEPNVTMPEGLTAEQAADLKEAVAAQMQESEMVTKYKEYDAAVQAMYKAIIGLMGTEASGSLAYLRALAITKLEEIGHRGGDAFGYISHRDQAAMAAVNKADKQGTIIKFPGK